MNKFILKNSEGRYFVKGSGFPATESKKATVLTAEEVSEVMVCAVNFGFSLSMENAPKTVSYACCYLRESDFDPATGRPKPESLINPRNPSRRRFRTFAGASKHGSRFRFRKSGPNAAPGSAGHRGFFVIETNDEVNAAINLKTGLTVPTNGAPKTFAARKAAGQAK